jgi:DNA-binding transcriptional LysR family regulator
MNLRWMMLFATIADEGSFTRAAARLNIAQPWLSAQMRKLEYELGVQLLVRCSTGVQTTQEGEALLPYARQLEDAARMFRETARRLGDTQAKTVQFGCHMPMLDIAPLRKMNTEFQARYSNFRLDPRVANTPDLVQQLELGEFDLVVALSPLPETKRDLETIALQRVEPFLLIPTSWGIKTLDKLKGRTVGIPPAQWHPEFVANLAAKIQDAGATTRTVPEFDRRAIEHFARNHAVAVVMVNGTAGDYAKSTEFVTIPLPDISAAHMLIRLAGVDVGRAAERFWLLAAKASESVKLDA